MKLMNANLLDSFCVGWESFFTDACEAGITDVCVFDLWAAAAAARLLI